MLLNNYFFDFLSDGLKYHIQNKIPIYENIFMYGSNSYRELLLETKKLFKKGYLVLDEYTADILETFDTGEKAIYYDRDKKEYIDVVLDEPFKLKNDTKKYGVYVFNGEKKDDKKVAIIVKFGDPNMEVANYDEVRRKSFLARHKCNLKDDKTTPGFWSCNVGRFAKELGLKSDKQW